MKISEIVNENNKIIKKGEYILNGNILKLHFNKKLLPKNINILPSSLSLSPVKKTIIKILDLDTFEALNENLHSPIVLDFASDTNPGGGYLTNQEGTQEESLCRRSNLGLLLQSAKYPIPDIGAIYIPEIVVFRNKDYSLMNEPKKTAVVASSLRNATIGGKQRLINKINLILSIAVNNNHRSIILGAWGCGAFSDDINDSQFVAETFASCLKFFNFDIVIFAIPKKNKHIFNSFFSVFNQSNT